MNTVRFTLDEYHRGISDDALLDDLKVVAKRLAKNSVTRFEYDDKGRFHSTTLVRRFGTWFSALEKAGLEKTRTPMNVSNEELFHNLEEIWVKLGRQPRYAEVLKPFSQYSVGTYEHRFGGWRKALESFVAFINDEHVTPVFESAESDMSAASALHKTSRNINWRLRFIVMRRDNFKCRCCGRSPATDLAVILHVDHIRAWANGGETVLENLQTLCSVCNIGKSNIQ
jgi:hypothetical protein